MDQLTYPQTGRSYQRYPLHMFPHDASSAEAHLGPESQVQTILEPTIRTGHRRESKWKKTFWLGDGKADNQRPHEW